MVDFHSRERRLGLLAQTMAWFAGIAFFRRAETATHYLSKPTRLHRRYHKTILATLIAEGERLLTRIELAGGFPTNLDNVTRDDVEATVEELRNTHTQWYGTMSAQRRRRIFRELFHGKAP